MLVAAQHHRSYDYEEVPAVARRRKPVWSPTRGVGALRATLMRVCIEFLALPTAIIAGFLVWAGCTHALDLSSLPWITAPRGFLGHHMFAEPQATRGMLTAIAAGIVTVLSITFSVLLLAVQQSATMMTNEVFDQFLHRRLNQIYIGFFIGLALYALIILATVHSTFNPVYGATCALIFTIMALYLLIILIYSSVNQMRPEQIIEAIHNRTLRARERQRQLLATTRRTEQYDGQRRRTVQADVQGFVTAIDTRRLEQACRQAHGTVEVVLSVSFGSYVAFHDTLAVVCCELEEDCEKLVTAAHDAIRLEGERDLGQDAAFGVEQLVTIGWTSISTAKSNPAPGIMAVRSLRDIWARWIEDDGSEPEADNPCLPVVYQDRTISNLLDGFVSLAVAASESLQHQSLAEIVRTLAMMLERLPCEQRRRVEQMSMRIVSSLGEHVLTHELDGALVLLIDALGRSAPAESAKAIEKAYHDLQASVGVLSSRSTRGSRAS
jgi:uncharacterized membrane protein